MAEFYNIYDPIQKKYIKNLDTFSIRLEYYSTAGQVIHTGENLKELYERATFLKVDLKDYKSSLTKERKKATPDIKKLKRLEDNIKKSEEILDILKRSQIKTLILGVEDNQTKSEQLKNKTLEKVQQEILTDAIDWVVPEEFIKLIITNNPPYGFVRFRKYQDKNRRKQFKELLDIPYKFIEGNNVIVRDQLELNLLRLTFGDEISRVFLTSEFQKKITKAKKMVDSLR